MKSSHLAVRSVIKALMSLKDEMAVLIEEGRIDTSNNSMPYINGLLEDAEAALDYIKGKKL